jgi:hypothetical protein
MYDAVNDPYTYEGSTVLKNLLDLREAEKLDAFEAEISTQRATEPLPAGNLDFAHYCAVHHHLFQDVYHQESWGLASSKSRIRAARPSCVIGFWIMATPGSSRPWWTMAFRE